MAFKIESKFSSKKNTIGKQFELNDEFLLNEVSRAAKIPTKPSVLLPLKARTTIQSLAHYQYCIDYVHLHMTDAPKVFLY